MSLSGSRRLAGIVALCATAVCACKSTQAGPSLAYAGTYHASQSGYQASVLTVTENGVTTDLLANGAVLNMMLSDDGGTTGRLFAPGADEGGGDLDVSLDGTWTETNGVVHFTQSADTFIRDIPFTLSGNLLSGTFTEPGLEVRAVLVKD